MRKGNENLFPYAKIRLQISKSHLGFCDCFHVNGQIVDLHLQLALLLLQLLFDPLQVVDLLAQLGHAVRLLLAQCGGRGLVVQRGLLQVAPQFEELGFALLVHLDLSGGGSSGLLQPLADLVDLPGEVGPLLLDLCPDGSFGLDFFLQFFNTSLKTNSLPSREINKLSV